MNPTVAKAIEDVMIEQGDNFTGGKSIVKEYISSHQYLVPAPRQAVEPQRKHRRRYFTGSGEASQMDWRFTEVKVYDGSENNAACFSMICHLMARGSVVTVLRPYPCRRHLNFFSHPLQSPNTSRSGLATHSGMDWLFLSD